MWDCVTRTGRKVSKAQAECKEQLKLKLAHAGWLLGNTSHFHYKKHNLTGLPLLDFTLSTNTNQGGKGAGGTY
jgi:hypothetical protein